MIDEENERKIQEAQKVYLEFLDDEDDQGFYHKRVKEMIEENRVRLLVNINDLRKSKPERADKLLSSSAVEQIAFKNALKQYVTSLNPSYEREELHVGFEGSFGQRHVTPRSLTSRHINNMICLEGIVTQCSLIKPKLVRSVHYCPNTGKMIERRYADLTSLNPAVTSSVYPTKDQDGNLLETEFGLSSYKDHQTLVIQEMPERAPAGQLPRAVDVICDDDLADKCKPGDRVQIIGLFRCLPAKKGSYTTGVFKTVVIANNITLLNKELKLALSRADITNCRKLGKKHNIFEMLSHSLAPSIHGHEYVKKAILCMLLGGVEKVLANGTRLRGDINILLIGDPSVAKSQLLRYVLCTAPRAIATTGRGSSGVGLTAAVTHDKETGERKLEAGAMVLADRGIVCIDEFDKMSDIDRTAIHEVMEQGRVTIAKAGIHARLNARCSVLAAANPIYGRYDRYRPPMENIGLQDSLLSRFDLLFVMLDEFDSETDSMISDHVLRMHQYRNPGEQDGAVLPMGSGVEFLTTGNLGDCTTHDGPVSIYEKYDPLLHGNSRSKSDRIFTVKFMRMYLHLAKTLKPVLTDEACGAISEEYARLRSQDSVEAGFARTQPVTVRTLETLIRLATAHAKARLSIEVLIEDAKAAIELVQFAYFKKVVEKERKKRRHDSDDSQDEDEDDDNQGSRPKRKPGDDTYSFDDDETAVASSTVEEMPLSSEPSTSTTTTTREEGEAAVTSSGTPAEEISPPRYDRFRKLAAKIFMEKNVRVLELKVFTDFIQTSSPGEEFSDSEINAAISQMTADNAIMLSDNKVYLI